MCLFTYQILLKNSNLIRHREIAVIKGCQNKTMWIFTSAKKYKHPSSETQEVTTA